MDKTIQRESKMCKILLLNWSEEELDKLSYELDVINPHWMFDNMEEKSND